MRPLRIVIGVSFALLGALLPTVPASAVSTDGALVFVSTRDGSDGDVFAQNADGSGLVQLTKNGLFEADPVWSPDGTRIAFTRKVTNATCPSLGCMEVFVMNADGSGLQRITQATGDGQNNRGPAWSPDGAWIAFDTTRFGNKDVMKVPAAGGLPVRLTSDAAQDHSATWSPDATTIVFVSNRSGSARLHAMSPDGVGQAQLELTGPDVPGALIGDPAFSPDGARLAFRGAVDRWSTTSIYVSAADGSGAAPVWTSPATKTWFGYVPAWSPTGAEIALSIDTSTSSGFDLGLVEVATGASAWAQRGAGDDVDPHWRLGSAPVIATPPSGASVLVTSYSYTPSTPTIQLGQVVSWEFASRHTASDRTGLGLYDSGAQEGGANYSYTFTGAGTFAFRCTLHPKKMSGAVSVPVTVDPTGGGAATSFTVRWASAAPPTGAVFDVMLLRPGAKRWASWKSGVATRSAAFVADAGRGTYQFRARVRISSKKASAYSPPVAITVS